MNNNIKALTLVELIVVITVLAILWTISTFYFFDYFSDSRDASRLTSMTLMEQNLELFFSENNVFPQPDNSTEILYEWGVAWEQWEFGDGVGVTVKNFWADIPKDPLFDVFYTYSVTNSNREYQIASILEGDATSESTNLWFTPQAHAWLEMALVRGKFNGIMVRARQGAQNYFLATPSIIANDISSNDALDIITQRKLVYDNFFNLPANYSDFMDVDGGFDFNVTDPLVFSWSVRDLQTKEGIEWFSTQLKYVYATTPTESFEKYISILNEEWLFRFKNLLTKNFKISFRDYFNCREILDAWLWEWNGMYTIDPDGSWPLWTEEVYCDMLTWWWGWTRVWWNQLSNGDFLLWADIDTYYSTYIDSQWDNNIVPIINPAWSYALHQTWNHESNYEVHFDDFSILEPGQEIRMRAWVADADGSWTDRLGFNPAPGYVFHNRINYDDGTFSTNGEIKAIETREIGWKTWQLQEVRHRITKQPIWFQWYIGLDSEDDKSLYVAGVNLEIYYGGYDGEDISEPIRNYTYTLSNWWSSSWWPSTPLAYLNILWVWNNNPGSDQNEIITELREEWHAVEFIDDNISRNVNNYDVIFVHEDVSSWTALNNLTWLTSTTRWVITSESHLQDNFVWSYSASNVNVNDLQVIDNTHIITSPFSLWSFNFWTYILRSRNLTTWTVLITSNSQPTLVLWNQGDATQNSIAAWKRVFIPMNNQSGLQVTEDGKELIKRSILWAGWILD